MKSKQFIFIIIISIILSVFAMPVMAAGTKVVNITRPDGNEVVTKEVFSICGICIYDDTTIELAYKDRETGKYKPLCTTDGDSKFKVGSNKIFSKDIELKKGDNEIRVIAYTKTSEDNPQENYYTITLADEKKKGNWFKDALDWLEKKL